MRILATLILALLLSAGACAQEVSNPDSLLKVAQQMAYAGKYDDALTICTKLWRKYPDNADYRIFTARVLAWKNNYAEAREYLEPLKENGSEDALDVLTDIELWSGNFEVVIEYCNRALALPRVNRSGFLLKRAKAQEQLKKTNDAISTLNTLLAAEPKNEEAQVMLARLKYKDPLNKITVSYLNSSFSNPSFPSWNFGFVEYKRDLEKCPLLARLNYGNINNTNDYQLETDAYPKFAARTYAYLNAGYGFNSKIFPDLKFGAELYQTFRKGIEASLGGRYMKFKGPDVFIYTGYLGYYYKNWWFSYRTYVVSPQSNFYFTHVASARKYFADGETYISASFIYGAAPYFYSFIQDIARTNASRLGIEAQLKIGGSFYLKPLLMYEYEEYFPGSFRNRWDAQLTLSKKF